MLLDKNGFFWKKARETYTRIRKNTMLIPDKTLSQIQSEQQEYELFLEINGEAENRLE
jgi:hypothetical protein